MCGRYTLTSQEGIVEDLEASLDPAVAKNEWWKPRFNVAPTQDAPVVVLRDGARWIEMMRWGLVPFWATRGTYKPPLMINARIESIESKQVFRDALARKRCLVPADGFFEWRHAGKKDKSPFWLHPQPRRVIAFAGMWARAKVGAPFGAQRRTTTDNEAAEMHSFTIVTGPPNELVKPLHDRMPVVLDRSAWSAWLDPSLDAEGARALLGVPPVGDWRADAVSKWVNVANHDDPRCIAPPDDESRQRSLF
jgi:putative SOS response-associated peptidase YedK